MNIFLERLSRTLQALFIWVWIAVFLLIVSLAGLFLLVFVARVLMGGH